MSGAHNKHIKDLTLKVWRQSGPNDRGHFETYNVVALIYLTLTIGLSLLLRRLEARLRAKA